MTILDERMAMNDSFAAWPRATYVVSRGRRLPLSRSTAHPNGSAQGLFAQLPSRRSVRRLDHVVKHDDETLSLSLIVERQHVEVVLKRRRRRCVFTIDLPRSPTS